MVDQAVKAIEDAPTTTRPGILGWMLFDWAAQPYFTVGTTFIFGPYFVSRLTDDPIAAQTQWSNAATIASFIIAIFSPILGSIADATGAKKKWIGFFAAIKIVSLTMLWFAAPGSPIPPAPASAITVNPALNAPAVFDILLSCFRSASRYNTGSRSRRAA
ncbi:hypothetical protein WDZ92_51055 [Nostoc sp. NIES-2111]